MMEEQFIKVGMADLNVAQSTEVLKTTGLGSCVGLTLYDPKRKIAGMAHVMLPTAEIAREGSFNAAKYADTAIPELIRKMTEMGALVKQMQLRWPAGRRCSLTAATR